MIDITKELKDLRLHGMASAWADLMAQRTTSGESSAWLIAHLLQAENNDRGMRSIRHQMNVAKFPTHRDLAGFDFAASSADRHLVAQLATLSFTDTAQNVVLIGGPGTGKTHLATAIAVAGIGSAGKRVRFYSTVDLVNTLEKEKRDGRAGRIAQTLMRMCLDPCDYVPSRSWPLFKARHVLSTLFPSGESQATT